MSSPSITPEQCAEKMQKARKIAVLTGAGISTAAGVPDFRGPKGLYVTRAYDPETVFDIGYFDRDPKPFYRFSRDFLGMLAKLEPTYTHRFLASFEAKGAPIIAVVTQNIDGLHQRAGSRHVYPMHGDYETAHCRRCGRPVAKPELLELMETEEVPTCPDCGGTIKPDVVFFGENVRHLSEAEKVAVDSDLMLVLGSSLTVYPAASLPGWAGGDVVIVNKGPVGACGGNRVFVADADLDSFFRQMAECLE